MTDEEQTQASQGNDSRPSRHALIMRGVVTPIFGLLAVAAIVLGVLNTTIWKPSNEISATAHVSGVQYVVTDPGVLRLLDNKVDLSVQSSGNESDSGICVALGAAKDVAGWVGSDPYQRITGMQDWTTLALQEGKNSGDDGESQDDANDVAFQDSDMWSKVACDASKVTLADTNDSASQVAIIDLGKSEDAEITLHWVRSEVPDFAMPFYLSGGLLAVLAVLSASVFAMPAHKRRKCVTVQAEAVEEAAANAQDEVTISQALAGTAASLFGSRKRRRRRRHAGHSRGSARSTGSPTTSTTSSKETAVEPQIVDPASRNLVADEQSSQQNRESDEGETTSVITSDELQAYFARLAQESEEKGDEQ